LGYELTEGKNQFDEDTLVVLPSGGGAARREEREKLRAILGKKHAPTLNSLQGAYEAYNRGGTDGRRQACEAARNALENLVRDSTGKALGPGIQTLSDDSNSRKQVLLKLRDFLSARGTHATEQPTEEDALLAIRITEDALTWILQHQGEW